MSAVRTLYQVICHVCGEVAMEDHSQSRTQAEAWFRQDGWRIGKKATCGFCVREKRAGKPEPVRRTTYSRDAATATGMYDHDDGG